MKLKQAGWSDEACLDFDLAFVWFDGWVQSKRDAVDWVSPDERHKGKVPRPRYGSVDEILDLYVREVDPDARLERRAELDDIDWTELIANMADGPTF